jgi:hypothetical protein
LVELSEAPLVEAQVERPETNSFRNNPT